MSRELFLQGNPDKVSPDPPPQDPTDLRTIQTAESTARKFRPLVVEIFAGTARLSRAVRQHGMRALAIDKTDERSEGEPIARFDLVQIEHVNLVKEILSAEQDSLLHVHFAPACGTASQARKRKVPGVPTHRDL